MFTINHFNGPTTYFSEGLLDRNLDSLHPDFVSLLCTSTTGVADGADRAELTNPFIKA